MDRPEPPRPARAPPLAGGRPRRAAGRGALRDRPAAIFQNDGQYGTGGTRYEASDVGQTRNLLRVERTSVELGLGRHALILLYAPFEVTTRVTLDEELRFRGTTFAAGDVVDHRYLFDGYRASYLYRLLDGAGLSLELGGSLQVRNAEVAFATVRRHAARLENDIGWWAR
jgi:hypothetical protein